MKRATECLNKQRNAVTYSLGISGNTKLIAFWMCELRTLMHLPTFIGNQQQSFFSTSVKRRNTFKPAWTNAATSLACDGVLGKEAKVVLLNLAGSLAMKSGGPIPKP
jgi:hypothetical protein